MRGERRIERMADRLGGVEKCAIEVEDHGADVGEARRLHRAASNHEPPVEKSRKLATPDAGTPRHLILCFVLWSAGWFALLDTHSPNANIVPQGKLMNTAKTSSRAICSLVLSIVSFVVCPGPLAGIPAIICGHVSRSSIRKSAGTLTGGRRGAGRPAPWLYRDGANSGRYLDDEP